MLLYLYSIQGCASHAKVLHVISVDVNASVQEEFDVVVVCSVKKLSSYVCPSRFTIYVYRNHVGPSRFTIYGKVCLPMFVSYFLFLLIRDSILLVSLDLVILEI